MDRYAAVGHAVIHIRLETIAIDCAAWRFLFYSSHEILNGM